jgi:hypothetical protein
MSHSKAAASTAQNLEITLAGAPKTPPRGTKRSVEAGEDADTPHAMRRTVSLPQSFDMGDVNLKTTTEHMRAQTGRDLVYGLVPDNAIIKTKIMYNKSKAKIGSNVILLTKDEDKGIVSVCWYTNPWQIGGEVVKVLNKRASDNGSGEDFKARFPGGHWVGIDKDRLTYSLPYIQKLGWIATPDTCGSAAGVVDFIKELSIELLNSNLPMDYYLAEIEIPRAQVVKYKVVLDILTRNIVIDVTDESQAA